MGGFVTGLAALVLLLLGLVCALTSGGFLQEHKDGKAAVTLGAAIVLLLLALALAAWGGT